MNKETYLQELRKALKVLPQTDRDEAIEFYEEYFDDAGIENEAKVIEELGDPKVLGKKILIDVVDRQYAPAGDAQENVVMAAPQVASQQNYQQIPQEMPGQNGQAYGAGTQQGAPMPEVKPKKEPSSGLTALKIVLAALFAIPLSPVIFALLIVVCVLIFVIFVTLGSLVLAGGGVMIGGFVTIIAGIITFFVSPVGGMVVLGSGLACFGAGLFMVIGFVALMRLVAKALASLFGGFVHRKNQKQAQAQTAVVY